MDGIEGSVESSNSCWSVNISACSSEIGTCIINDAGRQAVLGKTTKTHVLWYVLNLNTCINAKKKKKKSATLYPQYFVFKSAFYSTCMLMQSLRTNMFDQLKKKLQIRSLC